MKGTLSVLRAESYRFLHGSVLVPVGLFLAAIASLRVVAARAAEATAYTAAVQRAWADGRTAPAHPGPGNAYAPFIEGWKAGLVVGTLLLLILSALSLAADREHGILRLGSTRSISRGGLVLGRVLLGLPLVLGVMVITGLAAWVTADQLFVFGPLVEHGYELASAAELQAEVWRATLATLPPLLATWTFGLFVSSLGRSPVGTVAAALAAFLAFDLFKEVLGDAQYLVFAAFTPSFVDNSAMEELTGIVRGLSDAGYTEELMRMNLILPWPQALLLAGLSWWVLSRRAL